MDPNTNKTIKVIEDLIDQGAYDDALLRIEGVDTNHPKFPEVLNLKSRTFQEMWRPKEALECTEQVINLQKDTLDRPSNYQSFIRALANKANIMNFMGESDKAFTLVKEGESHLEDLKKMEGQNDLNAEIKIISTELEALLHQVKGKCYSMKGEFEEGLMFCNKGLELRKKMGSKRDVSASITDIGRIYRNKGELGKAMISFEECLQIGEELGNRHSIGITICDIGDIYSDQGELDQALHCYQKSLEAFEETANKLGIGLLCKYNGYIYLNKGELDKALGYFMNSLEVLEELGNKVYTSKAMLDIAETLLLLGRREEIPHLLNRLEVFSNEVENKFIILYYKFTKALYLKSSKRVRDKIDAERLFEQILNDETIRHDITTKSIINLVEILMDELSTYGEDEVLGEITDLLDQLTDLSGDQKSHAVRVQTLLMRAKLKVIEKDFDEANAILNHILEYAEDKGLGLVSEMVQEEVQNMRASFEEMQKLVDQNLSYKEMIEELHLMEYIKKAKVLKLINSVKKID